MGISLFLDLNACFSSQIRKVFSFDLFCTYYGPLALSVSCSSGLVVLDWRSWPGSPLSTFWPPEPLQAAPGPCRPSAWSLLLSPFELLLGQAVPELQLFSELNTLSLGHKYLLVSQGSLRASPPLLGPALTPFKRLSTCEDW